MLRESTVFVPRYQKFESISLQRRVCKLSIPRDTKRVPGEGFFLDIVLGIIGSWPDGLRGGEHR
jgi:hypothetical protein